MSQPQTTPHDQAGPDEALFDLEPEPVQAPVSQQSGPGLGAPTWLDVLRAQRKTVMVALVLAVVCFWVMGPLGRWQAAAMAATGILLALANHLASERWLGRVVSSGEQPTRGSMTAAALSRLAVLAVVAIGLTIVFWPDGIALLLGLAIFRLIALVMTMIPLLKELRNQ